MSEKFRYDTPPLWEAKYYSHFSVPEIIHTNWASLFAFNSHLNTPDRKDGSPYINHPLRMLRIAMGELGIYCTELNITMLLHDVKEELKLPFVNESVTLWFGLKNKNNMNQLTKTPENKKFYLLSIKESGDWIIILTKLIDRLDNMQTLQGLSIDFQKKQAKETQEFFLDLCDDLAKVIPKEYAYVPSRIRDRLESLCEQYGC